MQDASITISSAIRDPAAYNITTTTVANVDLVIIMTARPAPYKPVAGYASCLQRDQYYRYATLFACQSLMREHAGGQHAWRAYVCVQVHRGSL